MDTFANYYSTLYKLRDNPNTPQPSLSDIQNFLDKLHLPLLTEDQLQNLKAPISNLEISKAIQSLPTGKSPGPNGLPNEYNKLLVHILVPNLTSIFSKAMHTSSFPPGDAEGPSSHYPNQVKTRQHSQISVQFHC